MAGSLSEIKIPEYTSQVDNWEEYKTIYDGGKDLIDEMSELPEEDSNSLDDRKDLAVDFANINNEIQHQQDIMQMSGIEVKVSNDDTINDLVQGEGLGIDGKKTGYVPWLIDEVLKNALIYRLCWVVVDRAQIPKELTRAEAEKLETPYSYVLSPLNVPAWRYKTNVENELESIVIRSREVSKYDQYGFPVEMDNFYTLWTEQEIIKQDSKGDLVFQIPNKLGTIPVVRFELSQSLLNDLYQPVKTLLNHTSLVSLGAASQIYGTVVAFTENPVNSVDSGMNRGFSMGKDDKIEVIRSDPKGVEFNLEFADRIKKHIKEQMKQTMQTMTVTALQQSGISKKIDQLTQEQFSQQLSMQLEKITPDILGLFGDYLSPGKLLDIEYVQPDEFTSRDRDADRQDAQYLSLNFSPKTKTEWVALAKRTRKLSGIEENMTTEEIQEDDTELDERAEIEFDEDIEENNVIPVNTDLSGQVQAGGL